jgi:hypothetical protein
VSETEVAQSRMVNWTASKRPVILTIRLFNGKIVDARKPQPHQTVVIEFPILVAVRAKPISRVIVPLVCKPHSYSIVREGPELFDEPVIQFFRPFAREKGNDLWPSIHKFRAVSSAGVYSVGQGDFFRIAGIPTIFGQTDFLNCGLAGERRQRRAVCHFFIPGELSRPEASSHVYQAQVLVPRQRPARL